MSLKDRLGSVQQVKQNTQDEKQEQQPKYYNTDIEANVDSLGALDTILSDDDLNSVFVSGAKNIYLEKKGKIYKSTTTFRDNVQLENMLKKIALSYGVELDEFNPCFQFNHKIGISVSATVPPLSNIPTVFIKCYKDKHATFQTLQEELSTSKEITLILEALCTIKRNVLIIGSKNTLKTTLLSALAKKIPSNNRTVIIDSENEFKITGQNFTNYDFSKAENETIQSDLLNLIIDTNPDKLIINTKKENVIVESIKKIQNHYRGMVLGFCADNTQDAIEKLSYLYIKYNPHLTFEKARALILSTFDIIISTKKDDLGRRKISAVSQINLFSKSFIEDIFVLDYLVHKSTGIVPIFYDDIKTNSLPIGDNIFDINYKHTYHKGLDLDGAMNFSKKSANIDILKKFKKDLPTQNQEDLRKEMEQIFEEKKEEDLIKKAQEKFEEIKKNVQTQEDFEINIEEIQEINLDESQSESENENQELQ